MVDELILPGESKDEKQFTQEMEQLQNLPEGKKNAPEIRTASNELTELAPLSAVCDLCCKK